MENEIKKLEIIAYSNISDYVTLGNPLQLRYDIPFEKMIAVEEIVIANNKVSSIKLRDKNEALEKLVKYVFKS